MSAESGRKSRVGIGLEATRGTTVAPTYWFSHLEQDFKNQVDKELNESVLGVLDKYNDAEVMKEYATGVIGGKITDKSFPAVMALAFGAKPTASDNADTNPVVKDHTFAQNQSNAALSATLAIKDGNTDERYAMATLASLDVDIQVGAWAKWKADFLSKKGASSSNTVADDATENEFKAKHATVKLATNLAGLGAASTVAMKGIKFTIARKLVDYPILGSLDINDIFTTEVEITGDFTLLFDSLTHRTSYMNNTFQALRVSLVNSDVVIGATANPGVVWDWARVNFTDWGYDKSLENMIEQTIGFRGFYSLADAKAMAAVFTNTVASY